MTDAEVTAELVTSKALLVALGAAILALNDPTVHRYDIDTGQTRQVVWRHQLPDIFEQRRALMSEICTMELRLGGGGVLVQPGF